MLNTDDFTRAWLSKLYEFKIHDLEEPSNNMIKLGLNLDDDEEIESEIPKLEEDLEEESKMDGID